jgi:nucleoside-diphosphate-sugar epimerase
MPRSNYALQKMAGENYCRLYSELYGLDTVCLRYFNVCGINSRLGGAYSALIPVIMNAAVNGGIFQINGDGEIYRDYTPVENVIDAIILATEYVGKLNGECFNVALGQTFSINEVYDKICKLSGKLIPKIHGPERIGDPKKSLANISKIKAVLRYNPIVSFDQSLETTFRWWLSGCPIAIKGSKK